MQKVTECLILSERSYCVFAPQGFVTKCFLIFIVWMKGRTLQPTFFLKLVSQSHTRSRALLISHVLKSMQKCDVHILKSSEVLKWQKVSTVNSSTGIVEFRDKSFVLDLKLLFIIVDCFSRRFSPKFFYCETSLFHQFSWVIISCLIYFSIMHDIDMILIFVCFNKVYS